MIKAENRDYIEDLSYVNAEDFLHDISYGGKLYKIFDENFIYRGHSTDEYELTSFAQRSDSFFDRYGYRKEITKEELYVENTELLQTLNEYMYLERFFKKCDESKLFIPEVRIMRETMPWNLKGFTFFLEERSWLPQELHELAALAQHYGVPTRLIDWTQDINVAIYFAVTGVIYKINNKNKYTENEAINKRLNDLSQHYVERNKEKDEKKHRIEIWALDKRIYLDHIKDIPLRIIHPRYHDNGNLGAQKGVLTYWEIKKPIKKDKHKGLVPILEWKDEKTLDEHITDFLKNKKTPTKSYLLCCFPNNWKIFIVY